MRDRARSECGRELSRDTNFVSRPGGDDTVRGTVRDTAYNTASARCDTVIRATVGVPESTKFVS